MRLIDADALMVRLVRKTAGTANKRYTDGFNDALMKFRSMISTAPTIEAEPVKHGRWIEGTKHITWKCSECDEFSCCEANYCPQCGAKMDGGAE